MCSGDRPPRLAVLAAFAGIYLVWGSNFLAIRLAVETIPPFLLMGVRSLLAGTALVAWSWWREGGRVWREPWIGAVVTGALLFLVGHGSLAWGARYVPSGTAALLMGTIPLWMVLLEWKILGAGRPAARVWLGLALGLCGIGLLVAPRSSQAGVLMAAPIVPTSVLLLGAFGWASGSVGSRLIRLPESVVLSTGAQLAGGGLLLCATSLVSGELARPLAPSGRSLAALAYMIVMASIVTFTAYMWLLRVSTPSRVATYAFVNPVVAVFVGWTLEIERPAKALYHDDRPAPRVAQAPRLALACAAPDRAALLDEACAGDADLRREVESLLAQEPRVERFLESRPWDQAGDEGAGHGAGPAGSRPDAAPNAAPDDDSETDLTAPPVDAAGLFASRYRILRLLGRGGMGAVYEAEDVRLKRHVALKFLGADLAALPHARSRFLREAQAAAALDDPHVCTVYEAGEHGGRAFIAMAFIEGPTLKDRIAAGPLAIDDAVAVARDVAAGLAAAHACGVVHRDIKPGNVLLAGERGARITDFGLARLEGAGESSRTAGAGGTPAYMSPEQVQGLPIDHRTDIWSLGCVMHEMLTGRSPFSTASRHADVFAIVHGPPPPVAAWRPEVPGPLAAIVDRCLQPDLRRRYQRAVDVLADLDALLSVAAAARVAPAARATRDEVPSIAVLPFSDMSPDRSQAYFAEGMAEEIIHALARIEGLRVTARTSSFGR
jgi:drug/metabolite transporter (DMT)-like permease